MRLLVLPAIWAAGCLAAATVLQRWPPDRRQTSEARFVAVTSEPQLRRLYISAPSTLLPAVSRGQTRHRRQTAAGAPSAAMEAPGGSVSPDSAGGGHQRGRALAASQTAEPSAAVVAGGAEKQLPAAGTAISGGRPSNGRRRRRRQRGKASAAANGSAASTARSDKKRSSRRSRRRKSKSPRSSSSNSSRRLPRSKSQSVDAATEGAVGSSSATESSQLNNQTSTPESVLQTPDWAKADLGLYYSFTDPYLHNVTFAHEQSRFVCTMRSMRLVSLDSQEKHRQLANLMAHYGVPGVWTSGRRSQYEFFWGTGRPVSFAPQHWSQRGVLGYGQPDNAGGNEACLAILNNAFEDDGVLWHDVACHRKMAFACEPAGFLF